MSTTESGGVPPTMSALAGLDYPYMRDVPELGLTIAVMPMLYNDRVIVMTTGDLIGYIDGWCYDKGGSAFIAAATWDLAGGVTEPAGWKKHIATGRYREGGDPSKEVLH